MIPRFLNLQGLLGIGASVLLLGLVLVKSVEARRWHKQSDRYEQSWRAEQSARVATIANYRAAAETARRQDLANVARVAAEQRTISERTSHALQARLANARARADRLQLANRTAAAIGGGRRATALPAAGPAPGAAGRPAEENGFSLADRLVATEQAIQLDELIKWVNAQGAVDPADAKERR